MRGEKLRRSWSRESNHVIDPLQLNGTSLPDSHEHRWRRGTISQNAMTWEGQAIANKGQGELYCSPWCHCHALLFQRPHALLNDKNSTKIGTKTPNSQGPRYRRRIRHGEGWSYWCASNNGVFRTTPRLPSTSPSPCFFLTPYPAVCTKCKEESRSRLQRIVQKPRNLYHISRFLSEEIAPCQFPLPRPWAVVTPRG